MARMSNKYGGAETSRMNPDSSIEIYVTVAVEDEGRIIFQNQKIREEENKIAPKVNLFKNILMLPSMGYSSQNSLHEH